MNSILSVAQGDFQLKRIPLRNNELLQAWDAADEYLLQYCHSLAEQMQSCNLVILNDGFGALAVALHQFNPIAVSDSYLSHLATQYNLQLNHIAEKHVQLKDSLWQAEQDIDFLLIKAPKTLALLEFQLYQMRPRLKPHSQIIVAGMIKNLPATVWTILEKLLGPTRTSLAVKKARLIFVEPDSALKPSGNPYPSSYQLENTDFTILNHANVFSRDSLDIGSRFLLNHLPDNPGYQSFVDLGCGNGVIGLMIAKNNPDAKLTFVDESYMAVESARQNFLAAFGNQIRAEFIINNSLAGFGQASFDCIVCNPPFHQQHTIGDHIAREMFADAKKVLRKGGELRVIGNRHLNYHAILKKIFGNVRQIAGNNKFVILQTIKF